MTIIHQEKTIEYVPLGTLKPTDCFHLRNNGDTVWMYVEQRINDNGIDGVFALDMTLGRTQELPDTTLVEEVDAALIVRG